MVRSNFRTIDVFEKEAERLTQRAQTSLNNPLSKPFLSRSASTNSISSPSVPKPTASQNLPPLHPSMGARATVRRHSSMVSVYKISPEIVKQTMNTPIEREESRLLQGTPPHAETFHQGSLKKTASSNPVSPVIPLTPDKALSTPPKKDVVLDLKKNSRYLQFKSRSRKSTSLNNSSPQLGLKIR